MISKVNVTAEDVAKELEPVLGAMVFRGTWNATANVPNLGALSPLNGDYYIVSVAGSTSLGSITSWGLKDWAVYNSVTGWQKIDNTDSVTSVAGKTGAVTLDKTDVSLGNVDNTSDAAKPVSTAQQTALNLKANLASPTFTGTVGGITKSMVGLGSVDNTTDADKPISTATQTALNAKEATANKNANNGYMGLGSTGRAAQAQLPSLAIALHMIVGDGSDGNLTFDGSSTILGMVPSSQVYTLTRDIYAANLTVNSGVQIFTDGYRIFVRGKLTNAGTIQFNGKNASGVAGGTSYNNRGSMSISAGAGGNGITSPAAVGGGGGGSGGNNVAGSSGGNGGTGGAFGGGAGNSSAVITSAQGGIRDVGFFNRARLLGGAAPNGSGGGGAGGGNPNTGTVATGGGGGAAGGVALVCLELDNTGGVISADGGKGADASRTGDGVGGGGGGGAGGWVFVAAAIVTAQGTIRALGGAFGNGIGGGTTGNAGTQGLVVTIFPTGL